VYNPAFDVTPARLIAGIVTEKGIIKPEPNGKYCLAN
jgi:methylthioribose-1-phosphate isomerase